MTIAEKSTELGGGADLAEDFYQACEINDEYLDETNTTWECVKAQGVLAEGTGHNGLAGHNRYYCSTMDDNTITSSSTDAEVKTSIKAWFNALEWTEKAVTKGVDSRVKV